MLGRNFIESKLLFLGSGNKNYRAIRVPWRVAEKKTYRREKPHVLFIAEKWCDCNPDYGLSNSKHNLFNSLEASGLATYDGLHPDEYSLRNKRSFGIALLLKCIRMKPDIIVLTWPATPGFKTLRLIRKRTNIPVIAIWWDSVNHMEDAESFLPFINLNVVVDSTTSYLNKTRQPEKYLAMWTPQDPKIFYNPSLNRDIDVSFAGTMSGHLDRLSGISALRLNGIDVYQTGGQREHAVSVEEYAHIYMHSKIALNFCYHPNGKPQLKGRVFEITLCGAMLMESENSETSEWFEPMVDYVPFKGEKDLIEKVKYYLAHDSERIEIATRGHQKAKQRFTGEMFWKTIFGKVFK